MEEKQKKSELRAYIIFFGLIFIFFGILFSISGRMKSDQEVCTDTGLCKRGLAYQAGWYEFYVNAKTCPLMNGTWNDGYCDVSETAHPCDREEFPVWDTAGQKCAKILPDGIAFNSSIVKSMKSEEIAEFLKQQENNPGYAAPSYDKQRKEH